MQIEDKRKINLTDIVECEELENKFLMKIHKKRFYELLVENNISLEKILGKKPPLRDCHKFNFFLRKVREVHGFEIIDCLIFIEEEYTKFKKIKKVLDGDNLHNLKIELSKIDKKLRSVIPKNNLQDYIEHEEFH